VNGATHCRVEQGRKPAPMHRTERVVVTTLWLP
jgi:hypothetical protein